MAAYLADKQASAASDVAVVHRAVSRATQKQSCRTRGRLNPRQSRLADVAQEPASRRTEVANNEDRPMACDGQQTQGRIDIMFQRNQNQRREAFVFLSGSECIGERATPDEIAAQAAQSPDRRTAE